MYNWITLLYCTYQHNIVNQLYFNKINFKICEFNTFIHTHTHTHTPRSNWNYIYKRISREEINTSFVFLSSQGDNCPTEMKNSGPDHWRAASAYKPKMYGWVYQPYLWRITERAGTPSGKGSSMTQRSPNIRSRETWSKSWKKRKGHSHEDSCISYTESFFPGAAS